MEQKYNFNTLKFEEMKEYIEKNAPKVHTQERGKRSKNKDYER